MNIVLAKIKIEQYKPDGTVCSSTIIHIPYNNDNKKDFTIPDFREHIDILIQSISQVTELIGKAGD